MKDQSSISNLNKTEPKEAENTVIDTSRVTVNKGKVYKAASLLKTRFLKKKSLAMVFKQLDYSNKNNLNLADIKKLVNNIGIKFNDNESRAL